jgi:glycosyltransferase involved in cell wall biosynthesis
MRLAVAVTHPIQYQGPLWRCLTERFGVRVEVYFGSDRGVTATWDREFGLSYTWDTPILEGYQYTILKSTVASGLSHTGWLHPSGLRRLLKARTPDWLLLPAYSPFAFYLAAFFVARTLGIPVIFRGEVNDDPVPRTAAKDMLRETFLSWFYRRISKFAAIGTGALRHYLRRGVPKERIYWSPYGVDSDFFEAQAQTWSSRRQETRSELGFAPDRTVFLLAAKLVPRKDPLLLAEAFRRLPLACRRNCGLLIMGHGPLAGHLAQSLGGVTGLLTRFVGFRNQSEVGKYYAAADCLVLPSRARETWGLVVNEAMYFGLPAIVSDRVGCRHDLIEEGETGFVFRAGDAVHLSDFLFTVARFRKERADFGGEKCRRRVAEFSLSCAARGLYEALTC